MLQTYSFRFWRDSNENNRQKFVLLWIWHFSGRKETSNRFLGGCVCVKMIKKKSPKEEKKAREREG